jgi:hypothetical protein
MEQLKRLFYFLLGNTLTVTCLYFGAYKGIPGFMNVLSFIIWFMFVIFILSFINKESQKTAYLSIKKTILPNFLSSLIGVIYISVLVFYGHILLGALYLVSWILFDYMKNEGKKLVTEEE